MDPWSREADFAVLHVWGLDIAHVAAVHWARVHGKRVVISALLPYPGLRTRVRLAAGGWLSGLTRLRRRLAQQADALVVVNPAQARYAVELLGCHAERVHVIPNQVAEAFFSLPRRPAANAVPNVLCVGAICARKNQLTLARACRQLGVGLVLGGDVLPGQEAYGQQVQAAMAGMPGSAWRRDLAPGSPALLELYQQAAAFALPSFDETQPIAALEAVAAGRPLLLGDRAYARQPPFQFAARARPDSPSGLQHALKDLLQNPARYQAPSELMLPFHPGAVGRAYARLYHALGAGGTAAGDDPGPPPASPHATGD
jgi:glycosyltransferase involved in cell wall biosynthesis